MTKQKKDWFLIKETDEYIRKTLKVERKSGFYQGKFYTDRRRGTIWYCYLHKNKPKIVFKEFKYSFYGLRAESSNSYVIVAKKGRLYYYCCTTSARDQKIRDISHTNFFQKFYDNLGARGQRKARQNLRRFIKQNKLKIKFNPKDLEGCFKNYTFPLLKDFGIDRPACPNKYLRETRFKILVKKCFGNCGKRITSLVATCLRQKKSTKILNLGLCFKGFLSTDDWQKFIEKEIAGPGESYYTNVDLILGASLIWARRLLRNFSNKKITHWVLNAGVHSCISFRDSVRIYREYPEIKIPPNLDISELHNYLIREMNKKEHEKINFKYSNKEKQLFNSRIGKFSCKLPEDSHELLGWGQTQNHCVGIYTNIIENKMGLILGIFDTNELKYNIELDKDWNIVQFKGKYNQNPNIEDEKIIKSYLNQENLKKSYAN